VIKIKLSDLLGKHKMKVTELAEEIDVHKNTLYRLHREDSTRVDLEVLEKIFKYFGCKTEELIEYNPQYIRKVDEKKDA
jgi:putative transcriptional regulator